MTGITSEVLASARARLARTSRAARRGVERCAEAAQGAARLPRRLLHR